MNHLVAPSHVFYVPWSSSTTSLVTSWTTSHHQVQRVSQLLLNTESSLFTYNLQNCSFVLSSSAAGNLISHIFRDNEVCRDTEWERYFSYENIDVPEIYSGPRLTFPLTVSQVAGLVEAFKNKQVCSPICL